MASRIRRTKEQRIADITAKIDYHKGHIARLEDELEKVQNPPERKPRVRKTSMRAALEALKEAELSPDEIVALAAKAKKVKAKKESE